MGFLELNLWKDQEKKIHSCINSALISLKKESKKNSLEIEDSISGRLFGYLLAEKKATKLRAQVIRQLAIYESVNSSKPIGFPDIAYLWDDMESNQLEYHIECKRLKAKEGGFCKKYIENGISRYDEGTFYSNGHSSATMIGYIQLGSSKEILNEVNNRITDPVKSLRVNTEDKGISKLEQNFFIPKKFKLTHFWADLT